MSISWFNVSPSITGQSVLIRLLPPAKGGKLFCGTRNHRIGSKVICCTKILVEKKWEGSCIACDLYSRLWAKYSADGGEDILNTTRGIKPINRYLYNIVDIADMELPKVYKAGETVHQSIITSIVGDKTTKALGDVTDRKTGRNLRISSRMIRATSVQSYPSYHAEFQEPSIICAAKQWKVWAGKLADLEDLRTKLIAQNGNVSRIIVDEMGIDPSDPDPFAKKPKYKYRNLDDEWEG